MRIKLPVVTWLLAIESTTACAKAIRGRNMAECAFLLSSATVLFVIVSSHTGFSWYFQYMFPATLFVFAWMSGVWNNSHCPIIHWSSGACVLLVVCESLAVYPRQLVSFNAVSGGPKNGRWHLLDSNLDWGQDFYRMTDWLSDHPDALPFYLAYSGVVEPLVLGIEFSHAARAGGVDAVQLADGWYAISANYLHGYDSADSDWTSFTNRTPTDCVGNSILVFRIGGNRP